VNPPHSDALPKIVFITDRNRESNPRSDLAFGHKQLATWDLTCGEVKALGDGSREVGELYDRNLLSADTAKFVRGADNCTSFIFTRATDRRVLVLLHGFNTTFVDAIRRAVSFGQDVRYSGLIVVWSWPSYGQIGAYPLDESRNTWTAPHFSAFITNLFDKVPDLKVDFMAHSMGSRVLLQFISNNVRDKMISSVTFAAADVDAAKFKDKLSRNGLPISFGDDAVPTLYASAYGWALWISQKLHRDSKRAGVGGEDILDLPGLDSIDVNVPGYSTDGHSYIFDHSNPLQDFESLVRTQAHAAQRGLLSVRRRDGTSYFRINP